MQDFTEDNPLDGCLPTMFTQGGTLSSKSGTDDTVMLKSESSPSGSMVSSPIRLCFSFLESSYSNIPGQLKALMELT